MTEKGDYSQCLYCGQLVYLDDDGTFKEHVKETDNTSEPFKVTVCLRSDMKPEDQLDKLR